MLGGVGGRGDKRERMEGEKDKDEGIVRGTVRKVNHLVYSQQFIQSFSVQSTQFIHLVYRQNS